MLEFLLEGGINTLIELKLKLKFMIHNTTMQKVFFT
jgi:hypothetical protein